MASSLLPPPRMPTLPSRWAPGLDRGREHSRGGTSRLPSYFGLRCCFSRAALLVHPFSNAPWSCRNPQSVCCLLGPPTQLCLARDFPVPACSCSMGWSWRAGLSLQRSTGLRRKAPPHLGCLGILRGAAAAAWWHWAGAELGATVTGQRTMPPPPCLPCCSMMPQLACLL